MSDWEDSDNDSQPKNASNPPPNRPAVHKNPGKSKWDDEDQDNDGPVSDWEASSSSASSSDEKQPVVTVPPKKKGTLKAKLAEKAAAKAARLEAGDEDEDVSDDVPDPAQKALLERQREVNEDLKNAVELFGSAAQDGGGKSELESLLSFQPRTKEDFQELSKRIIECVIQRHQSKPLYASFVEHHVRQLAIPLRDVEVRKAASGLTTLANEKQKEQRDKASGKKKSKAASRPILGSAKLSKHDTSVYDVGLDDFGNNPDDFM